MTTPAEPSFESQFVHLEVSHVVNLEDVLNTVRFHYREEIAQAVKACLGVVASLSLKNRDHCLPLILEGGSGRGKSLTIRILNPDRAETKNFLERVDDFTPASFVSHAANKKKNQLAEIDLLPKIKDKVMLTKELAPLFRDEEKELRQNFARLTAILDGEGYKSHSGTQGGRGYEGRYIFNWIGATTPIPDATYRVMAQLGTRLVSYEIAGAEATEEELIEFAGSYQTNEAVEACRRIANDFIESYFRNHPVESVDAQSVLMSKGALESVVRYGKLIAGGRMEVSEDHSALPEDPRRVILILQTLARGLALADNRNEVQEDDLEVIRHVAFSSIPLKRRSLLRAMLTAGGVMKSREVEEALDISRPTALRWMQDLSGTRICEFEPGRSENSEPGKVKLSHEFEWLLPAPFKPSRVVSTERKRIDLGSLPHRSESLNAPMPMISI
jgi:hypothetical protein